MQGEAKEREKRIKTKGEIMQLVGLSRRMPNQFAFLFGRLFPVGQRQQQQQQQQQQQDRTWSDTKHLILNSSNDKTY